MVCAYRTHNGCERFCLSNSQGSNERTNGTTLALTPTTASFLPSAVPTRVRKSNAVRCFKEEESKKACVVVVVVAAAVVVVAVVVQCNGGPPRRM